MTRTQRVKRPTNCTKCGVRLRAKKDPYVPGTRRYLGRGLCSTCWKHVVKGAKPNPPRPSRCLTCGRGWDAVRYECRGLCRGCYSAQRYRDGRELVRTKMPAECVRCERPMRGQTAPPAPGTVRFAALGMCGACYAADRARRLGVTARKPPPTECVTCHQPMVARGAPPKPGHVIHTGSGLCRRCRSAVQRREKKLLAYVLGGAA